MKSGIVTLQSILRAEKDCATATHPSEMGVTFKRRMLTLMGLRRDRNPYNCVETVFSIVGYGTSGPVKFMSRHRPTEMQLEHRKACVRIFILELFMIISN